MKIGPKTRLSTQCDISDVILGFRLFLHSQLESIFMADFKTFVHEGFRASISKLPFELKSILRGKKPQF